MGAKYSGHGCTARETDILDREASGESIAAIAADLGVTEAYVWSTVRYYNSGIDSHLKARRAAIVANRRYLAAIAATGRSFA